MNKSLFLLRPASEADLPQVIDLDREAFEVYGTAGSTEVITARLAVFPDGFIVLTDQDGVILGYGSAG